MALKKVTYNDKSNPVPIVNRDTQATAEDFKEIKDVINDNSNDLDAILTPFDFSFVNADLTAGVLEVEHLLNTAFPKLTLKRPNGKFEETTQIMEYVDLNTIQLDFGGDISAGTWNGRITYQ